MKLKNNALQELYDAVANCTISISAYMDCSVDKAFRECDEKLSGSVIFEYIKNLEKEKEDLQQQLDAECKKKQALEDLGNKIGKNYYESAKRVGMLEREKGELKKQIGSLNTSLGRLRERYEEEVTCRRKWAKLAGYRDKRIEELQQQIELPDSVRKNCYDQGQTDLWVKLQDVKDMQPNEFDVECECLGDVLDMDLEDFLDAYKKWWEEEKKEEQKCLDDMRNYLHEFCTNRWCDGCPLSTDEFKCGRGYRFKNWCFPANPAVPDEDLKRYYEKVRKWKKAVEEEKPSEEVPCSFNWKLDGTEFTIETSIPKKDYDNIVKIISGKE